MKNIYLFLLSVVILCSCNDFLDREPKTNLSPGSFWKSEEDLRLAANVFYQNMNRSYTLDNQSADGFANVGNLENVILFIFRLLYINKIIITTPCKRNRIETRSVF